MSEVVDAEIHAIKSVLSALEPLDDAARRSVIDYVLRRLGIVLSSAPITAPGSVAPIAAPGAPVHVSGSGAGPPVHIETLKNEKKPRSANEMAALVAYYLSHVVDPGKRKTAISTQDIDTYFKIAKFPLPRQVRVTLQNARSAGYFDSVGNGEYRLNAVGYNLVAHNMPRGSEQQGTSRTRRSGLKSRASARPKRGK